MDAYDCKAKQVRTIALRRDYNINLYKSESKEGHRECWFECGR